jgi:quercetin dioxygenase-like cupin family protein
MSSKEAEARYRSIGLVTRYIVDEPGAVYEPERHEGVYLFTIKGSAKIRLENGEWITVKPGHELKIEDNQLHEAIVGPKGWEYIFAASKEEIERQGL